MISRIATDTGAGVRRVCATPGVPRSTYYHAAAPTASYLDDAQIGSRIEVIFKTHRRRYGYRRIRAVLAEEGTVCAPQRVRRLMRQRGLRALKRRHFVPRTSDGRADAPSRAIASKSQASIKKCTFLHTSERSSGCLTTRPRKVLVFTSPPSPIRGCSAPRRMASTIS
jgi:transposase InsO family protein